MSTNNRNGRAAAQAKASPAGMMVPMADPDSRQYISRETGRLDLRLSAAGTINLRRLHAGLVANGETCGNGRPVVDKADVVRWLFENLQSGASE